MKGLLNILKGMIIGISVLIPGISGGTMAMILGIYEDLIHAFCSFAEDWKTHGLLLLQVTIGGLLSLVAFSYIIENLLNKYPYRIQFLFIGIIIGGLPIMYRKYKSTCLRESKDFVYFLAGFIMVIILSSDLFTISFGDYRQGIMYYLLLYLVGIFVAIAMVLPGVSGALVLMTLGLYGTTLKAINEFNIPLLLPLSLGILTGIVLGSRLVAGILLRYPGKGYMMIIGFVTASMIPIFPSMPHGAQYLPSLAALAFGALAISLLRVTAGIYKG